MWLGYSLGLPRQYYEPIINNNIRNVVQPFVNVVNSWSKSKSDIYTFRSMQERTAKGLCDNRVIHEPAGHHFGVELQPPFYLLHIEKT